MHAQKRKGALHDGDRGVIASTKAPAARVGTEECRDPLCPAAAKSGQPFSFRGTIFAVPAVQCASFSIRCAANSNGSPFPKLAAKSRHRVRVWGVIRLA